MQFFQNQGTGRNLAAILAMSAAVSVANTILWSSTGAGFHSNPGLTASVGQNASGDLGNGIQSGLLVHPLLTNIAPITRDTTMEAPSGVLSALVFPGADVDGQIVSGRLVRAPLRGRATVAGTAFSYQPHPDSTGNDTVGFQVVDDQGAASDTAWISIRIAQTSRTAARPVTSLAAGAEVKFGRLMATGANLGQGGLQIAGGPDNGEGLVVPVLLAKPSDIHVQIYDNLGALVAFQRKSLDAIRLRSLPRLADGRRELSVRWDLRDAAARPVPPGVYLWKILVVADDGERLETIRKTGVKK